MTDVLDKAVDTRVFEIGQTYTVVTECGFYDDGEVVFDRRNYLVVKEIEGPIVLFDCGFVLNTRSRTFARAWRQK